MHDDRRQHARKKLNQPVPVLDLSRDAVIGTLVDISTGGLMLLAYDSLPTNNIFQLHLQLPADFDCGEGIVCGAESLWHEGSSESGKYWIGFQIIDIAPAEIGKIERLVGAL